MIITLLRTGGFTGIPFKKTIDTARLTKEEREKIESHLSFIISHLSLGQKKAPSGQSSMINNKSSIENTPDRFTYTLSVQDGEINQEIQVSEVELSKEMRELIEKLQKLE